MNVRMIIFGLLAIAMITPGAFARGAQEPDFPSQLRSEMVAAGFSESEAAAVIDADDDLDWQSARGSDPALIAQALRRAKDEEPELESLEQALLALELARTAVELESEGLDDRDVAVATLSSVSELVTQIRDWKALPDEEREENLGEIVRHTVSGNAEPALSRAREQRQTADRDERSLRQEDRARSEDARSRSGDRADSPSGSGGSPGNQDRGGR